MQLSYKPKVLLLDEPVKGFDPVARESISHTLKCVQETGCAILLATHDKDFIAGLNATRLEISNRRLSPVQEVLS
jgi:energy-coupling factor transport system ATP-binding protein